MYRRTILLGLVALFAVLAVVVIIIYTEMFRDDILSRTTETTTGKLDGGFWEKIIPVLGIPLLTLIASQFPRSATSSSRGYSRGCRSFEDCQSVNHCAMMVR